MPFISGIEKSITINPSHHAEVWAKIEPAYKAIVEKYPKLDHKQRVNHLGTLGTGNHFIEVCLDENENVWFLLHSGSRGVGNRFGTFFIELAKNDMRQWMINLPDQDLAYLPQGTEHFEDYVRAMHWAQDYALANRELMMRNLIAAVQGSGEVRNTPAGREIHGQYGACNCFSQHHQPVHSRNRHRSAGRVARSSRCFEGLTLRRQMVDHEIPICKGKNGDKLNHKF